MIEVVDGFLDCQNGSLMGTDAAILKISALENVISTIAVDKDDCIISATLQSLHISCENDPARICDATRAVPRARFAHRQRTITRDVFTQTNTKRMCFDFPGSKFAVRTLQHRTMEDYFRHQDQHCDRAVPVTVEENRVAGRHPPTRLAVLIHRRPPGHTYP